MNRLVVLTVKKLDILSAVACRLTQLTGKSDQPIHPKHLVPDKLWFIDYLKKKDTVLDLGSSSGQTTIKIAKKVRRVIGLEIDERLLSIANASLNQSGVHNVSFVKGDANKKLPFLDDYFDKVICSDVLEHLDRRSYTLSEIRRVLKKDGLLLLVTDNPDTSWKKAQKKSGIFYYADPEHRYEYPKDEIIKLLDKKGFDVQSIESVTYDTPLKGLIDLVGGFSLTLYKRLRKWKAKMSKLHPEDTTGFRILANKK